MEWNEDLMATGVGIVDQQHQEIIRRVNHLIKTVNDGEEAVASEAERLIDFLADYVVLHFHSEEELQTEVDYPGFEKHKLEHDGFIERFVAMRDHYLRSGISSKNLQELIHMSESWLIEHIAGSDARFAKFYRDAKE